MGELSKTPTMNFRWLRNSRDDNDPVLQQQFYVRQGDGSLKLEWVDLPVAFEQKHEDTQPPDFIAPWPDEEGHDEAVARVKEYLQTSMVKSVAKLFGKQELDENFKDMGRGWFCDCGAEKWRCARPVKCRAVREQPLK
jgi:hypothetical protein